MPSMPNPFSFVARALRAFFVADLKLRRSSHGLRVVLDDRPPGSDAVAPTEEDASGRSLSEREKRELRQMRASLATLLDNQASARAGLRQLAYMDLALDKVGLRALHKVPYEVLRRAHDQLEGLVTNWSDAGLAALRSKMAVALIEREPPTAAAAVKGGGEPTSAAVADAELARPETLVGDEAAEAEAALLAAYGSVALPGLLPAGEGVGPASAQAAARGEPHGSPVRAAEPAVH